MHLKKRLFAVAAVVAMTAAVLYGSTREIGALGSLEEQISWLSEKETIYCWYSDESMSNYINMAAVSFGEQEGVRVIPMLTDDSAYLEAINQASLSPESVPDVFLLSNDYLEKAYLAGLASEIRDTQGLCTLENFPKAALDATSYQGMQVAYPLFYNTSVLIYNDTYIQEWVQQQAAKAMGNSADDTGDSAVMEEHEVPVQETTANGDKPIDESILLQQKIKEYQLRSIPDTIDTVLEIADSYDAPDTVEGIMKWDVTDIFYNYWAVGNYMVVGGDAGDQKSQIYINNNKVKQCLETYKQLNQFFSIEADRVSYDSVVQDFLDGKIVYTIATTDIIERIRLAREEGSFPYEYGATQMPDISEKLASRSLSLTNAVVVNGYSTKKELANKFAAYMAGDFADELYDRSGKPAANRHADKDNEILQVFMQEYEDSISLPKMMSTGNFWMQAEVLFSQVWNGGNIEVLLQELNDQISCQVSQ
ncbi:MAG: sugar ABC transporter substrate-binding protein [Lachnospiraceae bacterium]|nr:sugar ABC transporter substrate-binding protein [Lachnospiraceae bacterium]